MELIKKANKYLIKGKNLEKLLLAEKRRRGIDKDNICFIAAANLAQYWWCDKKSYYESKEDELNFFYAYLYDKIRYFLIHNLCFSRTKFIINLLIKPGTTTIYITLANIDVENGMKSFKSFL